MPNSAPALRQALDMALIVQKFGGTSVGTPQRISLVADRIAKAHGKGNKLVVVVSAMGQTTDELIELARKVSRAPSQREMDMLLSVGERISMSLLSMALMDRGVRAISFTGSQTGIVTNQSHSRARIKHILGDRVRESLAKGMVAIVAGFQGVSEGKEITTLGRGGSDTTAVALAAALRADLCEIFTDVDGIFSADPCIVPSARLLKKISHDVMVEMSIRGAGVLHPRSVELAKQYSVPLCVRSSLNEKEGTSVVAAKLNNDSKGMEDFRVTGVTSDKDKMLISIELTRPTAMAAVWHKAAQVSLSVVAPFFSNGNVCFFGEKDVEVEWRKELDDLAVQGFVRKYQIFSKLVPLSVVGDRFSHDGLALYRVLDTLAAKQIPVTVGTASSLAITVAVSEDHAVDGVKALHEAFVDSS